MVIIFIIIKKVNNLTLNFLNKDLQAQARLHHHLDFQLNNY